LLSGHAACLEALRSPSFSVNRTSTPVFRALDAERTLGPDLARVATENLLMLDPPEHTRIRKLVTKAFTPRVVETLRPRIQRIVAQLLDRAAERRKIELIRDFAYPLPLIVIAEMLGVPIEDRDVFKKWSDELAALLDPFLLPARIPEVRQAFDELAFYFRRVFAERRREPRDDLVSSLVAVEEAGGVLSETELLSVTALLLGAGHETTTSLIANGVVALLRHPRERRRFRDNPELAASAVEELLRYDSPVQLTDRLAVADAELGGHRIRRGQVVWVLLGAANRDPEVFTEPERLDLGRVDNRHIAFGHGPHFCLGAALARVEAEIALPALFERFPGLSGDPDRLRYKNSVVLRGPVSFELSL
jgi:cytochrome P450